MGKTKRITRKQNGGKLNKKVTLKKLLSSLSLEQLLSKAQEEIDIFQYENAQVYCQEALKRDPENLKALEISASLCLETGNLDGAKHCLGRAITLAPEDGFTKYLSMGQLLEGKDSLQCYLKGIELIKQTIKKTEKEKTELKEEINGEPSTNGKCNDENDKENEEEAKAELIIETDSFSRKLSNAYSAVAELYMSDLCDEKEAEVESLSNIKKSIEADPTNPEAYQHHANFLLIKENVEEAKEMVKKSVSLWLPKYQAVEDGEAAPGSFDPVEVCPLTQSVRFQTARILIEVEEYQLAADVLEGLLGEDDEVVYTWYLLGWNFYLQDQKYEAKQHFERAMEIHASCPSDDDSIIEHMTELLKELKNVVDDNPEEDDAVEELEREIDEMDVS